MKKVMLCLNLLFLILGHAADITEVPSTRVNGLAPAFSAVGRVQVLATEALVRIPMPDGKITEGDLLVLYDADTKRFLWRPEAPGVSGDLVLLGVLKGNPQMAVFSSPSSMSWWRVDGTSLVVDVFTDTARTLDEAFAKSLAEFNAGWDSLLNGVHPYRRTIEFIDKSIQEDLIHDRSKLVAYAYVDGPPAIVDINRANNQYKVTLKGRWIGETTITEDFQVKERFHRKPLK